MKNNIEINNSVSISSIIILYELIVLLLFFFNIINKKTVSNLVSWLVFINFYIIFVMFFVNCNIDNFTLYMILSIKIILLLLILSIAKINWFYMFLGISLIIIYYLISNINNVYNCNVKSIDLIKTFLLSALIYSCAIFCKKLSKK